MVRRFLRNKSSLSKPTSDWELDAPFGAKTVAIILVLVVLLILSGQRTEIHLLFYMIGEAVGNVMGLNDESQVVNGIGSVLSSMLPLQFSETTEISRIVNFDAKDLPLFARIESTVAYVSAIDPATLQVTQTAIEKVSVYNPIGYLTHVIKKMAETIEIAIWATLFSIIISVPLAYLSSKNYTPSKLSYILARGLVSFFRAIPELISAMFLVIAFGFGPIAGILALALHSAGFLGKFYAEDIENAEPGPQEALRAIGVSKFKILRFAVLPQVLPQYIAYNIYILDRNVRMATVIGIVGAGGIGQELKGRYDMFDYGHVATILMTIFATVFILDRISSRIRTKFI